MELQSLDQLSENIDRWEQNLKKISGTHTVPYDKLMPPVFMNKYTNYSNINQFFKILGIHNAQDLERTSQVKLDKFVQSETKFQSWEEMCQTAANIYTKQLLNTVFD